MKFLLLVMLYVILQGCGSEIPVENKREQIPEQTEDEETVEVTIEEARPTVLEETEEVVIVKQEQLSTFDLQVTTDQDGTVVSWNQSSLEEMALVSSTTYDLFIGNEETCSENPLEFLDIVSNQQEVVLNEGQSFICLIARNDGKVREANNSPYVFDKEYTLEGLGYFITNQLYSKLNYPIADLQGELLISDCLYAGKNAYIYSDGVIIDYSVTQIIVLDLDSWGNKACSTTIP